MFKWLDTKNAEAFGVEMAKMVKEMVPSDSSVNESKRASKANYSKEKMQKRINQFKESENLNFYKLAKLLNAFKWELKDAGYEAKISDSLSAWLLTTLRAK
ncbi:MAG: hypothetical protein RLZZ495_939 [Pseudomonadota bacterium]|jgi:hypothetical protein